MLLVIFGFLPETPAPRAIIFKEAGITYPNYERRVFFKTKEIGILVSVNLFQMKTGGINVKYSSLK